MATIPRSGLEKLEAILALSDVPLAESLPIFAGLLSIDQHRYPPSDLTAPRQRSVSHRIIIDWLHHVSRINRVLLSIEDEQWIDPSSSDVLEALLEEVASFPMLILITTREKTLCRPLKGENLHKIALKRLSDYEAHMLVSNVSGGKPLPSEIQTSVLNRAEGVPLYVEELARTALETGGPLFPSESEVREQSVGVPNSLQSSLLSRLDKLGPGKMIAQTAAVIGREFDLKLLSRLSGLSARSLNSALRHLVELGYSHPSQTGRATYSHTRCSRRPHTTLCCENVAANFMARLRRPFRRSIPNWQQNIQSSWHNTIPKQTSWNGPLTAGLLQV